MISPAVLGTPAGAHGEDLALLGLLLGGVRDHEPADGRLLGLGRSDDDAVLQRLQASSVRLLEQGSGCGLRAVRAVSTRPASSANATEPRRPPGASPPPPGPATPVRPGGGGVDAVVERGRAVGAEPPPGGRRDHRRVVGAERRAREHRAQPGRLGLVEHPGPQRGVGRDPAADDDRVDAGRARPPAAASSRARRRPRPGTTRRRRRPRLGVLADALHDRGLEPGEREVVAVVEHRARERDRVRVALAREPVDDGSAGIAEPEEARDLVERLARRVVDGLAEHPVVRRDPPSRSASCGRPTRRA